MRAGLYIHFPFCRAKCPYCHFYSLEGRGDLYLEWWEGLKKEAEGHIKENLAVETIYLGGGTPSLLRTDDLRALWELLDSRFWLKTREFTLEANPDVEDDAVVREWREAGVTRRASASSLSTTASSRSSAADTGPAGRGTFADRPARPGSIP